MLYHMMENACIDSKSKLDKIIETLGDYSKVIPVARRVMHTIFKFRSEYIELNSGSFKNQMEKNT